MPRTNTRVAETKYSTLSTHQIMCAIPSAIPENYIVCITGRTGGTVNSQITYTFPYLERHPLPALGCAVAHFYHYHPSGTILKYELKRQIYCYER